MFVLAWFATAGAATSHFEAVVPQPQPAHQCELPKLDASNLTWAEFKALGLRGKPLLVTGLAQSAIALSARWGLSTFLARFGAHIVKASNGHNLESDREHYSFTLREFVESSGDSPFRSVFLSDLLTPLQRDLFNVVARPPLLTDFVARPVLSIGLNGSGEDFHAHEETWLLLLQGVKAWWVADSAMLNELRRFGPCDLWGRKRPPGVKLCVQHQGEAVFFGRHAHATCNLEHFQLGIGAQGHTETWPMSVRVAHTGDEIALADYLWPSSNTQGRVDVQSTTTDGRSALHQACVWGHVALIKYLVDSRADVAAMDSQGMASIHFATIAGHTQIVRLLHDQGGMSVGASAKDTLQTLHFAAMHGHLEICKFAVQMRADFRARAGEGGSEPLHFAAKAGHAQVAKHLIAQRADVHARSEKERLTPLHFAAAQGHVAFVKSLLRWRADDQARDWRGTAPVHLAVVNEQLDTLAYLLRGNPNRWRPSLLHFAAEGGKVASMTFLVTQRADVQGYDERGFQPCHLAALGGHTTASSHLFSLRAAIGDRSRDGFLPIHFAAKGGHANLVEWLIRQRVSPNSPSKDGLTPRDVAHRLGHRAVVKLLLSSGRSTHIRNQDL